MIHLSPKELQPMLHLDTDGFPKPFIPPRFRNPTSKQSTVSIALRTCFSVTRNNGVVGTVLKKARDQLKLFLAIFGQISFWLGAWNLEQYDCVLAPDIHGCLQGPNSTHVSHHHRKFPLDDALYRGCLTTAFGFVLAIISNTLYLNAGLEGNYFPWCGLQPSSAWHWLVLVPRTLCGLVAGTCLFSGTYVILQQGAPGQAFTFCKHDHDPDWCAADMVVHLGIFVLGIFFVVATGTFCNITYLLLPEDSEHATKSNVFQRMLRFDDLPDADALTFGDHVWCSIRAIVCVFGQSFLWFSSTRALDYTTPVPHDVVWRSLFFAAFGLAMLYATDSVFENSFMDEEEDEEEEEDHDDLENKSYFETDLSNTLPQFQIQQFEESILGDSSPTIFYMNAFVSLCGQLIFQYGVWEYMDVFLAGTAKDGNKAGWFLTYRTTEVNLFLVCIGLVMMKISGCLLANACIGLYPVTTPSEEEAVIITSLSNYPDKRSVIYVDACDFESREDGGGAKFR